MRLLIIEDERPLANVLKKGFEEHAFTVDLAFNGKDDLFLAENYAYDALILDIGLPEIDGLSLLRTLRKKGIDTPVLMLTARRELKDKVAGLETGPMTTSPSHSIFRSCWPACGRPSGVARESLPPSSRSGIFRSIPMPASYAAASGTLS